jgi:hypothetical protein
MNEFLKKLGGFLIPVFLFCFTLEIALRNIPNDYSYKRSYLDRNSNDIEVLFLGSSHAYRDINPAFIEMNGFNAAYVSQSLDLDYAILRNYYGRWESLRYIVVPISYFSLFFKLETSDESWRIKNYTIYYGMNASYHYSDYFEILSNAMEVNIERINLYYLQGESNITVTELGWGGGFNENEEIDLVATGKSVAQRHTYPERANLNENVEVLNSFVSYVNEKEIEIIFYTPPAFYSYVENLDASQLDLTVGIMTELDKDHDNVLYVNYLMDETFTEYDFFDADHLNALGAAKLTKTLSVN